MTEDILDGNYDEIYRTKDGSCVVARRGCAVMYMRDGEGVADYALANEDLANKKFNQLKRLMQKIGGEK